MKTVDRSWKLRDTTPHVVVGGDSRGAVRTRTIRTKGSYVTIELEELKVRISKAPDHRLDYNALSSNDKQTADALIDINHAKLDIDRRSGRAFVVGKRPNAFLSFATMGVRG